MVIEKKSGHEELSNGAHFKYKFAVLVILFYLLFELNNSSEVKTVWKLQAWGAITPPSSRQV